MTSSFFVFGVGFKFGFAVFVRYNQRFVFRKAGAEQLSAAASFFYVFFCLSEIFGLRVQYFFENGGIVNAAGKIFFIGRFACRC